MILHTLLRKLHASTARSTSLLLLLPATLWAQQPEVEHLTSVGLDGQVTLNWEATNPQATYNVYQLDADLKRKAQLNTEPIEACTFTFGYDVDEGDIQHKDHFQVTQVIDGIESQGQNTGVVVGRPYALPYRYNFMPTIVLMGKWFYVEPDLNFWEGENACICHPYSPESEYDLWMSMGGHHSTFTTGKVEVKRNTYFRIDVMSTYINEFSAHEDCHPEPVIAVYAIDPYGHAFQLTADDNGLGYKLDDVAHFPWTRIMVQVDFDYDDDLWHESYYWIDGGPSVHLEEISVRYYPELDSLTNLSADGICYQLNLDNPEATVIHPSLMGDQPAYCDSLVIPAHLHLDGVTYPVTALSADAFTDNYRITSLELPSTIQQWQASTFRGCTGLKSLYLHHTAIDTLRDAALGDTLFMPIFDQCTLYVPAGTLQLYRNAPTWRHFYRICEYDYSARQVISTDLRDDDWDDQSDVIVEYITPDILRFSINLTRQTAEFMSGWRGPYGSNYDGRVVVPDSLEYEGRHYKVVSCSDDAFGSSICLSDLTLPSGILMKEVSPFYECLSLYHIRLGAVPPTFCHEGLRADQRVLENATLYVPMGCRELYRQANVWRDFENPIIEVDEEGNYHTEEEAGIELLRSDQPSARTVYTSDGRAVRSRQASGLVISQGHKSYILR